MLLGLEWLRNNVTDMPCTDASPQKRLTRPPGADKGRVGAFCVSALQSLRPSRHNLRGIFADVIVRPIKAL